MKRVLLVIALAAMLVATTGAASAGTTRIYFTGKATCPDDWIFSRMWEAGAVDNWQVRGIVSVCRDKGSIPQVTGTEYLTDGNIMWGPMLQPILTTKDRMETKEGGAWVGSAVLPANTDTIQINMHGEGLYEGMQLHMFESYADASYWGYIEVTGK
jgi:hypothetical protein